MEPPPPPPPAGFPHRLADPVPPHYRLESQGQQLDLEPLDVAAAYGLAADGYPDFHDGLAPPPPPGAPFGLVGAAPSPSPGPPLSSARPPSDVDELAAEARPFRMPSGRIVPDPPQLAEWRARLFNVDEPIVLTHDE